MTDIVERAVERVKKLRAETPGMISQDMVDLINELIDKIRFYRAAGGIISTGDDLKKIKDRVHPGRPRV